MTENLKFIAIFFGGSQIGVLARKENPWRQFVSRWRDERHGGEPPTGRRQAVGPVDGVGVDWQQCPSGRPAATVSRRGTRQPDVKSWIITVKRDDDGRRIDDVVLYYH